MTPEEALRQATFGPDKILDPEHADHVRGVVIRAILRHADMGGVVRNRIANAVAEALTGKQLRPNWCPDCRRIAEEDGDILPPACPAHGGPPEVSR